MLGDCYLVAALAMLSTKEGPSPSPTPAPTPAPAPDTNPNPNQLWLVIGRDENHFSLNQNTIAQSDRAQ